MSKWCSLNPHVSQQLPPTRTNSTENKTATPNGFQNHILPLDLRPAVKYLTDPRTRAVYTFQRKPGLVIVEIGSQNQCASGDSPYSDVDTVLSDELERGVRVQYKSLQGCGHSLRKSGCGCLDIRSSGVIPWDDTETSMDYPQKTLNYPFFSCWFPCPVPGSKRREVLSEFSGRQSKV